MCFGMIFRDRVEAGRRLAGELGEFRGDPNTMVLAIPRGGVVVGAEVARALGLPLDLWIARKLGAPFNPELAIGAISPTGEIYLDKDLVQIIHVSANYLETITRREQAEAQRRAESFRAGAPPLEVRDRTVLLVDDGVATGATVQVAIKGLHKSGVRQLVLAVPVIAPDTLLKLKDQVDQLVVLHVPEEFPSVSAFYQRFPQVDDSEVIDYMRQFGASQRPL